MSSHAVNKPKNYSQQNNISRVQHQSINSRGPAPENHSRPEHRPNITYSSVAAARQGIPQQSHQTHEIGKSHPSANTVQQVVLSQQPNIQTQVSNVNPAGAQMNASAVANSGGNLQQVLQQNVPQMSQSGPHFQTAYHQRPQQHQRPLLPNQNTHRMQSSVPQSGVPQNVPQAMAHSMSHSGAHQHYVIMPPQQHFQQQLHNQIQINQLNHSYNSGHRQLQPTQMSPYYAIQPFQQQSYNPPQAFQYMYPSAAYTHPQQTAQMMPTQMHQSRAQVNTGPPVIQTNPQMTVQMSAPSNEVNETTQQIPQQKPIQKRQKHLAVLTDPNSGKKIDLEELAKEEPKIQTPVTRSSESHPGASNLSNTSSNTSPNDMNIAIQFATEVARRNDTQQPSPGPTISANAIENTVSFDSNTTEIKEKLDTNDGSVANSKTSLSELNETNDKNSDNISDNTTEDSNTLVNKTISTNSASNSSYDNKTDDKLLNSNSISAQNSNEINSQTSVEKICAQTVTEVTENGSITELSHQTVGAKVETPSEIVFSEPSEPQTPSEVPSTPVLPDLPYKENQWTPLKPDGKRHYDREFLFAVRNKSESALKMPESLHDPRNQEIIRKESSGSGHAGEDPTNYFMPNYAKTFGSRLGGAGIPQINRRQSQPGRHQEKQRKIISTSLTQDVKLHTTENAWKPTKVVSTATDPEELETLELLKKIRGILNKLTPQKYMDLLKQIESLEINTEDRLKRVLDLVFDKAVDEPAFCLQYANLCKHLSSIRIVVSEEEIKFYKLLIGKCQKEFEADIYASITDMKERMEEINGTSDPQKKKMLTEILDEDMRRARKRSLGNIKLIGELYKLNMLKANIMVQCIETLIKESDDESLECLCALFKTIGEQMESESEELPKYKAILDNFFLKMSDVAEQRDPNVKGTSSRVRFMLRDVIDMRKNRWKARRDENLPKMIDEIHKEAQKEDEQVLRDLHQHTLNRKQEERDRKQKGGRQGESLESNTWTTVIGRKSQNAQQPNVDWQKMRSNLQQQNHDNVQLGPQTGTWSFGSRGGAQSAVKHPEEKQINRFSALDANDKKSQKTTIPSRDSSKGRSNQQHNYQQSRGNRSQGGGRSEREDVIHLTRMMANQNNQRHSPSESSPMHSNVYSRNSSRSGSREASAPNSRNSSIRRETPDIEFNQLKGQTIKREEFEKKCEVSVKEYLNVRNINEAVMDLRNLCNESNVDIFIEFAINRVLESSSHSDQRDVGKLFNHLIIKNIIGIKHFYKGLNSLLENAADIEIDIPKFWDYIAVILAPVFVDLSENRKNFILEVIKNCDPGVDQDLNNTNPNKRAKFVANLFKAVAEITSETKAYKLWDDSDLNWKDFLGSDENIEKFVEQNSVEFTTKLMNSKTNYLLFGKEVEVLVKQKKTNDEIQSFISKHFDASQTSDHRFTSALFSAVLNACIIAKEPEDSHSYELDKDTLVNTSPLLSKFLGGDQERELQALIVLQELMEKLEHPPSLLQKIFQELYDHSVISHDAFLQWDKSDNNSGGKAVAAKSVVRFMTWLAENEDDEEDNEGIGS